MAQEKWLTRFLNCLDRWIDRLNVGNQNRPFRITAYPGYPNRRPELFGIVVKPPPGDRLHADGQRWKQYPGPTLQQAKIMTETSPGDQELIHRLDLLVLRGQDTTVMVPRSSQPQLTQSDVDRRINEQVELLVKQKVEEIMRAHNARPVVLPSGLQERPKRLAPKVYAAARKQEIKMWQERATLMDYTQPPITSGGWINKLWIKSAGYRWEEYCRMHPDAVAQPAGESASV